MYVCGVFGICRQPLVSPLWLRSILCHCSHLLPRPFNRNRHTCHDIHSSMSTHLLLATSMCTGAGPKSTLATLHPQRRGHGPFVRADHRGRAANGEVYIRPRRNPAHVSDGPLFSALFRHQFSRVSPHRPQRPHLLAHQTSANVFHTRICQQPCIPHTTPIRTYT